MFKNGKLVFLFVLLSTLLISCSLTTPDELRRREVAYNNVTQNAETQQLLMNIIRLAYGEQIEIFGIGQISTGTTTSSSLSGLSLSGSPLVPLFLGNSTTVSPGYNPPSYPSGFSATYTPSSGGQALVTLEKPTKLSEVVYLLNIGDPLGYALRVLCRTIGKFPNYIVNTRINYDKSPAFLNVVKIVGLLNRIYAYDNGRFATMYDAKIKDVDLVLSTKGFKFTSKDRALLRAAGWGGGDKMVLTRNPAKVDQPDALYITSYSVLGMMGFLSHGIQLSSAEATYGIYPTRVASLYLPIFAKYDLTQGIFKIDVAKHLPRNVYVATYRHGYWYYIKETSGISKFTLAMVQNYMQLQQAPNPITGINVNV